ncbi:MAG: hypothetical protein KIT27_07295 [Legionellales bacterium]|nr:hypothetical protein [Legionellales bacterium]
MAIVNNVNSNPVQAPTRTDQRPIFEPEKDTSKADNKPTAAVKVEISSNAIEKYLVEAEQRNQEQNSKGGKSDLEV